MKNFCKKHTLIFIILVAAVALSSNLITGFAQNIFSKNLTAQYWAEAVCKYSISVIPLILMYKWGYTKKSNKKKIALGFALGSILLLFMAPNLISLILVNPILFDVQWWLLLAIIVASFSIGLMEEAAIRGVILPLLCEKWKNKKHTYIKAAAASSLLFACIHLNWSVSYLLEHGNLPLGYFMGNMYQVYYTFCFGILAAGVTMYARSILPMVFWHSLCDLAAFIIYALIPYASVEYYNKRNALTLQNVFNTFGILEGCSFGAEIVLGIINLLFVVIGVVLIKKAEKIML